MSRKRLSSISSVESLPVRREQELSNMYDYLAKIILIGPSGCGKSCLLHRFVKDEWRILSSQTIGVEFATKIVRIGTGARRKRIKLQLWDTAGTERFRSVSRSYYRGAAGAILVYDISSHASFQALPTFLNDARALASPHLTVLLAGNKSDTAEYQSPAVFLDPTPASSYGDRHASLPSSLHSNLSTPPKRATVMGSRNMATIAPEGREVSVEAAAAWTQGQKITVAAEVSALTGDGIEELFTRLASTILTRIELGEIDPSDASSGIQYGDAWGASSDGASVRSGTEDGTTYRRGKTARSALREWEEVFRLSGRRGCC